MNIQEYTTARIVKMAQELNLDYHDSGFTHALSKHLFMLGMVTDKSGELLDYKAILVHLLDVSR
ncbi:hypothetical protein JE944_003073 [Yersinia ruckeri]|nr:hypothetical protein [Yersinia ruckeri]